MTLALIFSSFSACAAAITGTPALAAAPSIPSTITFHQTYRLYNPTTFIAKGTRSSLGGCQYSGAKATLAAGEKAIEIREVAVNTQSCQMTFERGVPSSEELAAEHVQEPPQSVTSGSGRAVAHAARRGKARAHSAETKFYGGYVLARQKDPAGITVTSEQVSVEYNTDGSCINFSEEGYADWWEGLTGWVRLDYNWKYTKSGPCPIEQTWSSRYVKYYNESFPPCFIAPLYVWYDRTAIFGYTNGSLEGFWPLRTNGAPCGELLSYDGVLVRTA